MKMRSMLLYVTLMSISNLALAKNENSAIGAKELLERIESLEAEVTSLKPNPDIAGSTYIFQSLSSQIGAFDNPPVEGIINGLWTQQSKSTYSEDGTGYTENLQCKIESLVYIPIAGPPYISETENVCSPGQTFTYTQTGSDLEVTRDDTGKILNLNVSADGNVITWGIPNTPFGVGALDGRTGAIYVGIRVVDLP